ncbi:hypothetical protein ACFE04_026588 [Oxalis oulophora]
MHLDAVVLQFQNQKLLQKLEVQKIEHGTLEKKLSKLEALQYTCESTLRVARSSSIEENDVTKGAFFPILSLGSKHGRASSHLLEIKYIHEEHKRVWTQISNLQRLMWMSILSGQMHLLLPRLLIGRLKNVKILSTRSANQATEIHELQAEV